MCTSSTLHMVLEKGISDGSSLLVSDLLCCLEQSLGLWPTNSEISEKIILLLDEVVSASVVIF